MAGRRPGGEETSRYFHQLEFLTYYSFQIDWISPALPSICPVQRQFAPFRSQIALLVRFLDSPYVGIRRPVPGKLKNGVTRHLSLSLHHTMIAADAPSTSYAYYWTTRSPTRPSKGTPSPSPSLPSYSYRHWRLPTVPVALDVERRRRITQIVRRPSSSFVVVVVAFHRRRITIEYHYHGSNISNNF